MKCYIASKSKHYRLWQELRAAGVPIVASWIDWSYNGDQREPSADEWREHWDKCIFEAAGADVTLFVNNEGETACGALIEVGAALAAGRQVFIVSNHWWSVSHHPRCRVFPSVEAAIAALIAMQEGERAKYSVQNYD